MENNNCQRNELITFGKYKGRTILEVLEEDPQYLLWANENVEGFILNDAIFFEAHKINDKHKIDATSVKASPDFIDIQDTY